MSYILQVVTANGIAATLLCLLLLNFRGYYQRGIIRHTVFFLMILLNLLQCFLEPVTLLLDGRLFPGAVPLLTVLNALLYTNNIVFAMMWLAYADLRVRSIWKTKIYPIKCLPGVLVLLGSLANLFTPVFFEVSQENIYTRTDLFIVPFAVSYFYLLMGTWTVYRYGKRTDRYVFIPAASFLTPVFAASLIQLCVPGISLLWAGSAIGLCAAYIWALDEASAVDVLSGTYSRHYMNQYINALLKQPQRKTVVGIMLDIDKFKSINDRFGHLTGDDAITSVGALLRRTVRSGGVVFRYAGDEFVILMETGEDAEVEQMVGRIQEAAERFNDTAGKPYRIHFSIGYTDYIPGESGADFLKRMDDAMYDMKKRNSRIFAEEA